MTQTYLLSIDQGTTSTRAIVFGREARALGQSQREITQSYPKSGWVEHDPDEIWALTLEVCKLALKDAGIEANQLTGIGITNQRETTILWDRETDKPVYPAIVWQDRRTSATCVTLKEAGLEDQVQAKTGLRLDPYFSATKIGWVLDNVEGARAKAEAGELAFGTVDTFLLWRLTGGKSHKTDATNAARTCLFNIHTQSWDAELLEVFGVPEALLPEVCDCAADFGLTDAGVFGASVPVAGMAGDQQAALIGQACFTPGMIKSTYGTGCFMILNTGDEPVTSQNRLLTTVAYRLKGKTTYALEGSIFIAGATVQWLRDGLKLIESACETEAIAQQVGMDHGVYLVPAFTGLGAPHWDPDARGAMFGITRSTSIADIVSAGLQSVAYQSRDLSEAMQADCDAPLSKLRIDGGMAANDWFVQFLSDLLHVSVDRPAGVETTALGAALLAGLQLGVYESLDAIAGLWRSEQSFEPLMDEELRGSLYEGWQDAVGRVRSS